MPKRFCVIHPKTCTTSARELAALIGADSENPWKTERRDFTEYEAVFNYGVSASRIKARHIINPPDAVANCISKINTYELLKQAGIPTIDYVTDEKDVPKDWEWVVCRETETGRNCDGVLICPRDDLVPKQPLYTRFVPHDEEYRIVHFNGKILGRYRRKMNKKTGEYDLVLMRKEGFEDIDEAVIASAKVLGIDYAGFDVLSQERQGTFQILEANSGALLIEEAQRAIIRYFKAL
jgi:glutathione synthase/RimK-type ligase-like ATP-grasp enzyme